MKHRWTIKQLDEFSDMRIVAALINERLSELNPYAPLANRLKSIRAKIADGKPLIADVEDDLSKITVQ